MATQKPEELRNAVSEHYSQAITTRCTGGCCGSVKPSKEEVFKFAGYSERQIADLPDAAVVSSFGCGNPVAFAGVKTGDVVVDLGSGAGLDLLLAAKVVGPTGRVIGIDMTDEMIAKAKENIRAAGANNVEVRKGIIEDLPVEGASVDWVISNCVINLSPEKDRVFREIARVLKPGGQMLVSDIVANDLPKEILEQAAAYTACVAGALSEDQYIQGLRQAGLSEITVRERLVYDTNQLQAAVLDATEGTRVDPAQLKALVQQVKGKVWSAQFYAQKGDQSEARHA